MINISNINECLSEITCSTHTNNIDHEHKNDESHDNRIEIVNNVDNHPQDCGFDIIGEEWVCRGDHLGKCGFRKQTSFGFMFDIKNHKCTQYRQQLKQKEEIKILQKEDVTECVFCRTDIENNKPSIIYKCPTCHKVLSPNYTLQNHLNICQCPLDETLIIHQCQKCQKILSTKQNLQNHLNIYQGPHDETTIIHQCHKCQKILSTKRNLKNHLSICQGPHNETTIIHQCQKCQKILSTKQNLQNHLNICQGPHNETTIIHQCQKCQKILSTKRNLQNHLSICQGPHDETTIIHQCPYCGQKKCNKQSLRNHLNICQGPHEKLSSTKRRFSDKIKRNIIKNIARCQMCQLLTECGECAHIVSSGKNGPRNKHQLVEDGTISSNYEINVETNGLYLCANCHTLIDRYPERYTYEYLVNLKHKDSNISVIHDPMFLNVNCVINHSA